MLPFSHIRVATDEGRSRAPIYTGVPLRTWLRCEQLEDRVVPARTLVWAADGNWATAKNWTENGIPATTAPDDTDTVVFDGTSKGECTISEAAKVAVVDIKATFEGKLTIGLGNGLEATDEFKMAGGTVYSSASALVQISKKLTWSGGTVEGAFVRIGSDSNDTATATIAGDVASDGGRFENFGTLTWASGNISVGSTSKTEIYNQSGATIDIQSAGKIYDPNDLNLASSLGLLQNEGLLKFRSNGTTTVGRMNFNNLGTTEVHSGIAEFKEEAYQSQSGSIFELKNNSTAKFVNDGQVFRIYNGTIIGNGTINGNLTLGYDGEGAASEATIDPGWTTTVVGFPVVYTPGTITITQSFHMFDTTNVMRIDGTASGAFDQVVVTATAIINGVAWVNPSSDYHPPLGTKVEFLKAGQVQDDFVTKTLTYQGPWFDAESKPLAWYFRKTDTTYEIYVDHKATDPDPDPEE